MAKPVIIGHCDSAPRKASVAPILPALDCPFDPGQRDHAVQPVRRTLPPFGAAAKPLALADIRPELVEVTAQAVRLQAQLTLEPPCGADAPERERAECKLRQAR